MKSATLILIGSGLLFLGRPGAASAHEELDGRIEALNARIAADARNAALYFERGEAHRAHAHWQLALDDFQKAAQLAPGEMVVELARGRALMGAGRLEEVARLMGEVLRKEPAWTEARTLQRQALVLIEKNAATPHGVPSALFGERTPAFFQ